MQWLLVVLALLAAHHAYAHDLWLEKEAGGVVLQYGHKHSAHEGEKLIEYPPLWVKEALCFDREGARVSFEARQGYPYRMLGDCAVSYVLMSSGFWSKTPYGTKNVPKTEARLPIKSWLSYESTKRFDRWDEKLAKPLTQGLEITPLHDPLSLREGKKLRLMVSFEGQPVEGVVVAYDGKPRGATGADGTLNIRIRHSGFQVLQASLTRPYSGAEAEEVIHSANLTFELPEKR